MSDNGKHTNVIVRIQRFNPDNDQKPRMQDFQIELKPGTTILDALQEIKTHQDGSVTYRKSCRHAICGSCAMNVNGKNELVCKTPLRERLDKNGVCTVRPLPYLPIIKDLVVDRTAFWEQYLRVKPWLAPPPTVQTDREYRVSQEEVAAIRNAETCIMCGACYSACQVIALNKKYIGPHALLKAFLRVLDPRDAIPGERLADLDGSDGVYRCHTIFNCIDACPKGLNPTEAIETLRKLAQRRLKVEEERLERQKTITEPIA
ncbi:MAG: succinate dehydrogenase iron-sulfur subunit [Caldilineales bacterium]|nr:succinate dehydrogenase iron-sulfur subunit [Caldilineales bacterium]